MFSCSILFIGTVVPIKLFLQFRVLIYIHSDCKTTEKNMVLIYIRNYISMLKSKMARQ